MPESARRAGERRLGPGFGTGALAAAVAMTVGGCALGLDAEPMGVPLQGKTRFESEWRRYVALPEAKALAVAGDLHGVYVSGTADGETTADAAAARALARCQERRADRRIGAPCRMYGIGNEVVAPETGPEP